MEWTYILLLAAVAVAVAVVAKEGRGRSSARNSIIYITYLTDCGTIRYVLCFTQKASPHLRIGDNTKVKQR